VRARRQVVQQPHQLPRHVRRAPPQRTADVGGEDRGRLAAAAPADGGAVDDAAGGGAQRRRRRRRRKRRPRRVHARRLGGGGGGGAVGHRRNAPARRLRVVEGEARERARHVHGGGHGRACRAEDGECGKGVGGCGQRQCQGQAAAAQGGGSATRTAGKEVGGCGQRQCQGQAAAAQGGGSAPRTAGAATRRGTRCDGDGAGKHRELARSARRRGGWRVEETGGCLATSGMDLTR